MLLEPPFTLEQVKSINTFQRTSEMFTPMRCSCGGMYYAKEEGLFCKKCFSELATVPLYIANGTWNIFRAKPIEEEE
jgi:hypothetical protein